MIKFIFFLIIFTAQALTCEITLDHYVVKIKKEININDIKNKNCSDHELINLSEKLSSIEGYVLSSTLVSDDTIINPRSINIYSLDDFLNKVIEKKEDYKFFDSKIFTRESFISIGSAGAITCKDCESSGLKSFTTTFKNKPYLIQTNLLKKTSSLVAKKDLSTMQMALELSDFEIIQSYIDDKKHPISTKIDLRYYKLSKKINRGEILTNNHLYPIELIKIGNRVEVTYKKDSINLKSSAIARTTGKFGDTIQLVNPKNQKKIQAIVTDFNKAEIQ